MAAHARRWSVLVVGEDEADRAAAIRALDAAGFETREVTGGGLAEGAVERFRPDIVLLEFPLAERPPMELAGRLSSAHGVPVVFLARPTSPDDAVAALEVADDFVTQPFSAVELAARLRAVLRRRSPIAHVVTFADLALDEARHEARRRGELLELTSTEFRLLRFFMLNPRRVLRRREIVNGVWGEDRSAESNLVETYVGYLRQKLARLGPPLLHTVRGVGYVLREST